MKRIQRHLFSALRTVSDPLRLGDRLKLWGLVAAGQCLALALSLIVVAPMASAQDVKKAAANADKVLRGDAKCTGCHDDPQLLSIGQARHGVRADARTPTCTSCHGASDDHVSKQGDVPPDRTFGKKSATAVSDRNDACLACHKNGARSHWAGSQHESRDLACASCHNVHAPSDKVLSKVSQAEVCFTCHKTERAQSRRISTHPLTNGPLGSSAKLSCSDCHNPHGSTGPKLLAKNSVNDTCFTCHAEKRGPMLFEHSPVTDDCTNCHTLHGSNTAPLLKARLPFLCQQCHQDHGASLKSGASVVNGPGGVLGPVGTAVVPISGTAFGKSPSVQGNGRMCLNCHVMIHGSNAPSGAFFNR